MLDILDPVKGLDEIYVTKTHSHIETGKDGISKQVSRTYNFPLTVKTVNAGPRFVHLIVDEFAINIASYILAIIGITDGNITALLLLILFPVYYTLTEYYYQQTLGKMVTGSVVIDNFARKPDFRTCLFRTFIRLVPFEPFSCLSSPSRGWHDKWTKTYVVNKKEVEKLQELIRKHNEVMI